MTAYQTKSDATDPLAGFRTPVVLSHVQPCLIFWGSAWSKPEEQEVMEKLITHVKAMRASDYFSGLAQYNNNVGIQIDPVTVCKDLDARYDLRREHFKDPADPESPTEESDVVNEIKRLLDQGEREGGIDLPKTAGCTLLSMVIMPPQKFCSNPGDDGVPNVGQHFYFDHGDQRVCYGWVLYASGVDKLTTVLSEELVEAITDPVPPTGWVITDNIGVSREISDVCEAITDYVTGNVDGRTVQVLVKDYYSLQDRDAIAGHSVC